MGLLTGMRELASLDPSDSFFLLHPAQFTLRNEPSLTTYCTEHTALYHLLAKALEQLILRLIGT